MIYSTYIVSFNILYDLVARIHNKYMFSEISKCIVIPFPFCVAPVGRNIYIFINILRTIIQLIQHIMTYSMCAASLIHILSKVMMIW